MREAYALNLLSSHSKIGLQSMLCWTTLRNFVDNTKNMTDLSLVFRFKTKLENVDMDNPSQRLSIEVLEAQTAGGHYVEVPGRLNVDNPSQGLGRMVPDT